MELDACIKKITNYLTSKNAQPLLVNVQNGDDLDKIVTHFDVDENDIIDASTFCKKDELLRIETLLADISTRKKNCILVGLTSFLRFYGEEEIKTYLATIVNMTISGHVAVMTYQCEKQLHFSDPRLSRNICFVDGDTAVLPQLVFMPKERSVPLNECVVDGIENAVKKIENPTDEKVFVITAKHKDMYKNSIYSIIDMSSAYEVVIRKDAVLASLDEKFGTSSQWEYLFDMINSGKSFAEICGGEFGSCQNLEMAIPSCAGYSERKKWLYFIALKLFGAKNNACLNVAANNAQTHSGLIREIFRSILEKDIKDADFNEFYRQRKSLLIALGNPLDEVVDFCKVVLQKEEKAIYYLTDNTKQEKELILILLEKYYRDKTKRETEEILSAVYPDLYSYIRDYRYNIPLLDKYFSMYTHSKVINRVIPELEELMTQQAKLREYNLLLEPRTSKICEIDKSGSQLYFMDAMGVEYLSFIIDKCKEKELTANVTVCCANLPSITSKNKEFVTEFEANGIFVNTKKELDKIKHHGTNDYDYRYRKQPFHIIRELEIIDETLDNIKLKLSKGECKKAVMVSDHGASRLAVIHETENMWEMASNGIHSGRCCPKTDADVQSEFATEEDGFWVLANYDRFKGGRKANVEVHGGATLEEVVIPIIEITEFTDDIEISVVEKVITVSYRKKAAIRLFSKTKLQNVTVKIDGKYYEAKEQDNNMYLVDIPQLKKAKRYSLDVYSSNRLVAPGLYFEIKKEISQEKEFF